MAELKDLFSFASIFWIGHPIIFQRLFDLHAQENDKFDSSFESEYATWKPVYNADPKLGLWNKIVSTVVRWEASGASCISGPSGYAPHVTWTWLQHGNPWGWDWDSFHTAWWWGGEWGGWGGWRGWRGWRESQWRRARTTGQVCWLLLQSNDILTTANPNLWNIHIGFEFGCDFKIYLQYSILYVFLCSETLPLLRYNHTM